MSYSQERNLLFYNSDLDGELRALMQKMGSKVDSIPKDQFLTTPDDILLEHLQGEFVVDPIVLYEDTKEMEHQEVKVDVSMYPDRNPGRRKGPIYVSGISVSVQVPFSGDARLWRVRSNPSQAVFPRGTIREPGKNGIGYLEITVEQPTDEPQERIKQRIDKTLQSARFFIDAQRKQIEQHNQQVPDFLRQAIANRRGRLREHDRIAEMLKIPLKQREGAPTIEPLPMQRKLVRPLPPSPASGYKPEPGISSEDYEHILSVIRHEGRTFEATPTTYFVHDEEELRDILLAHLNGHYQGDATGETFRRSGKTDIRIETEERAAFVAECKVWRGQKELSEAVDQLLGYLTWRDCKAALVIFNKHMAGFSDLLGKVPEALKAHKQVRRDLRSSAEGEWRFEFASLEEEVRRVAVHIFLFNLFVRK
jgi:hypothetical protein